MIPGTWVKYELIPEVLCAQTTLLQVPIVYDSLSTATHLTLLLSLLGVVQDGFPGHLLGDHLHPAQVHVSRRFAAVADSLQHLSPVSSSPTYVTCLALLAVACACC